MRRARKGEVQAFIRSVVASGPTAECVHWPFSVNASGYGTTAQGKQAWLAHRLVYLRVHGVVPALLRHTCDNRLCVNPAHLLPGTNSENMRDMVERGRACRAEARATKLTLADVQYIRREHIRGVCRYRPGNTRELADKFGVCTEYILDIVKGKKWHESFVAST